MSEEGITNRHRTKRIDKEMANWHKAVVNSSLSDEFWLDLADRYEVVGETLAARSIRRGVESRTWFNELERELDDYA